MPLTVCSRKVSLLLCVVSVVALLLIGVVTTTADAAGTISWKRTDLTTPFHQSHHIRLSLQSTGTFDVGETVVRLATGDCQTAGTYTNYTVSVPTQTISEVIPYLSVDDLDVVSGNSGPWVVGFRPQAGHLGMNGTIHTANVILCYSQDRGNTWLGPAATAETVTSPTTAIPVWRNIPAVTVLPLTAGVAGEQISFFVQESIFTDFTAANVYGALVTDRTACDQAVTFGSGGPTPNIAPAVALTAADYSFKFTLSVTQAATKVYLCISVSGSVWSLAPVDKSHTNFVEDTHSPKFKAAPFVGYEIRDVTTGTMTATYSCVDTLSSSTTLTAGRSVTCEISIAGVGAPSAGLADLDHLHDGNGDEICPKPVFTVGAGALLFTFTPQRHGSLGLARLRYNGQVLATAADAYSSLAFDLGAEVAVDVHAKRFLIVEGDPYPQTYSGANQVGDIDGTWTGFGDFQTTNAGLRWPPARTASTAGEDISATLLSTVTTGSLQKDITIPANQLRFQFRVKYFFTSNVTTTLRQNSFIGRVRVSMLDSGGTEVDVIRDLTMFSYLRGVVIEGSDRNQVNDGDIRFEEQLQIVGAIRPADHVTIRVRIEVDHTSNEQLWFIAPILQYAVTTDALDSNDLAALQAFYTAVATTAPSVVASWRTPSNGAFNGDPCFNRWKGVRCRFGRIVGLELNNVGLSGALPAAATLGQMTKLESINFRNNSLSGVWNWGTGATALRTVRIVDNQFTAIDNGGVFVHSTHTCLKYFNADSNLITALPTSGLLTHKALQRFKVQNNVIAQAMPSDFSGMVSLTDLSLGLNQFTGSFPSVLPLYSLASIDVGFNQLTGVVPRIITSGAPANQAPPTPNAGYPYDAVNHFQQLEVVDMSRNQLSGIFPIYPFAMARFGERLNLNAQFNFFTTTPPRHFSHRSDFAGNFFTCPLPFTFGKLIGGETFAKPLTCDYLGYVQPADSLP